MEDTDLRYLSSNIGHAQFGSNNDTLNELVEKYDSFLNIILDKHAPRISRMVRARPNAPWYTDDLRCFKREVKKLERRFKKTRLISHQEIFLSKKYEYSRLPERCKRDFYSVKFSQCGNSLD